MFRKNKKYSSLHYSKIVIGQRSSTQTLIRKSPTFAYSEMQLLRLALLLQVIVTLTNKVIF